MKKTIFLIFIIIGFLIFVTHKIKKAQNPPIKIAFDASSWNAKKNNNYLHRYNMVDDIIERKILKRLNKKEVIELLGTPERINLNYLYYTLSQERIGLWPLSTKTLVIKLSQDTSANAVMIHG